MITLHIMIFKERLQIYGFAIIDLKNSTDCNFMLWFRTALKQKGGTRAGME